MAEYSELIKRFDKIRDYMRDFYLYGFKSREDFKTKSLRSYDNEKRRIESYLSDMMSFRQDENGKNVFISVDSAFITANPLYRAFKAKTFTKNDIALNFFILDILSDGKLLTAAEIADTIANEYLTYFENSFVLDLSTVRNKLKEYENLGLLTSRQENKKLLYSLDNSEININNLCDALVFFSEISPLGVTGSYLLDKCNSKNKCFSFKHHYIMQALDSEIVEKLLQAMSGKKNVKITTYHPRANKEIQNTATPIRFLVSVAGGRRYITCYSGRTNSFTNYRVDYIKDIEILDDCEQFDQLHQAFTEILSRTWGTSFGKAKHLETLTMTLKIGEKEDYIIHRINREGRNGNLTQIDNNTYKYELEVYDAREVLTWVRTFVGRIKSFECSNKQITEIFYNDLNILYDMYGE